MRIVAGAQEHVVFGLQWCEDRGLELKWVSEDLTAGIRCLAHDSSNKHLLAGTGDDMIRLYDLNRQCEVGMLLQHSGAITSIAVSGKVMVSTSEDGTVGIWRVSDWNCLTTLPPPNPANKGSKMAPIRDFAIHRNGRVALSLSGSSPIKAEFGVWNLETGKKVAHSKLPMLKDARKILWIGADQTEYAIVDSSNIHVYSGVECNQVHTFEHSSKVLCAVADSQYLVCGLEDGSVCLWNAKTRELVASEKLCDSRIKSVDMIVVDDGEAFIATGNSDGTIALWVFTNQSLSVVDKYTCGLRVSCVSLIPDVEI